MPAPYDLFDYPSYWVNRQYEDNSERIAIKKFFKKVGRIKSLVDIGAGFGRLTPTYLPFVEEIVLCDPSIKLLRIARKNFSENKKITFKKASLPKLEFPDISFDAVLCVRVFHHVHDVKGAILEVFRILKPGGFFILEFANKIHFLSLLKEFLKGNFSFLSDIGPVEKRSRESILKKKIVFLNHHPKKIIEDLKKSGLEIQMILSVSNFRDPIVKKLIPLKLLLFVEKYIQRPLSFLFFGPSVFVLVRKPIIVDN